jgi:hypothetical protein
MSDAWSPDPSSRPSIAEIVKSLRRCYSNTVHRLIYETPNVVSHERLQEENYKLSIIHDNASKLKEVQVTFGTSPSYMPSFTSSSAQLAGSAGTAPSSSLNSNTLVETNKTNLFSQHFRLEKAIPPTRELIETVSPMKLEGNWSKLDEDGAYLVLSPQSPHLMLW